MGYRTTFISEWIPSYIFPKWFKDKYESVVNMDTPVFIYSKQEIKMYHESYSNFFEDYRKALNECGFFKEIPERKMNISCMGEDGFITKVIVLKDKVRYLHLSYNDIEDDESYNDEELYVG